MGGRFIASEIHIAEDGPVSDWVHHHDVDAQVIVCVEGWVEVVYEDQGPAFVMHPGDAVLQPPHIRHRVLRAGGGLRVVEITGPAIHQTFSDHDMELPTSRLRRTRDFSGQRFHRHIAASGSWALQTALHGSPGWFLPRAPPASAAGRASGLTRL